LIKRRKIFFGWWTVLTGGILSLWGQGYYLYGLSALFKPISAELGFSRTATSVPASIGRFEGGIESPIAGWVTDKFGPRWLVLAGVFLLGLGLILMNFINSLWAFYVVWGVIMGTGQNIALTLPMRTAISNWFVKKRGLAQSIQMVLSALSGVLVLPLIVWLITTQGWRNTVVIGGVVMWLVGLPLTWFFVKQRRPEYYGLLPDGATAKEETADADQMIERGVKYATEVEEVEFTLKQALRTPTYWLMTIAQAGHSIAGPAFTLHAIPFLTDRGIDPLVAAGLLSMRVAASIPARMVCGLLADRVNKNHLRFIMSGAYLLQGIGITIYLLHPTITMIYVWFILYGIGQGAGVAIVAPMKGRYFGRKAYGSILGIATAVMAPVGIIAPVYFGWTFDTTGSYIGAFTLVAIMVGAAGVLAAFVPPPKPPAQITDVRTIV